MSENEKSSHWNSLASEIGAESAPRPAKPQVRPPAAPPRAKKKPATAALSPPKGNWQDLAASLGVDVPPPPPKPAPPKPAPPKSAAPPKPATPPPAVSAPPARATEPSRESREQRPPRPRHDQPDRERSGRRRGQPDRPARPASPRLGPASGEAVEYVHAEHVDAEFVGAEFVDDIDLLEDLDEPLTAAGEGRETQRGEAGQRDDEQRGGRRRRRRRRGGRRLREDAQAARNDEPRDETSDFLEVEFAEGDGPTADFLDDVPPAFDEEDVETDEPREVESGEAEPREKRRRGRRRGRGRGRTHDAGREGSAAATERTAAEDDDLLDELAAVGSPRDERQPRVRDDLGDVDTDSEIDADADDDAQDDAELRPSHRAIPSWQEAVGMIVAANMESRAKNPHSASQRPRGRGGRGRGRGRERR
ncbi:MAG TPA: hypothetical protein VFW87_25595 [Pirellulales bacterium]|nr:hypothetical protein [Pirellulales bacterium]